jgi:muconate cycloisomerase
MVEAEGVTGYGQIRPLLRTIRCRTPLPAIATIKDVCGPRLILEDIRRRTNPCSVRKPRTVQRHGARRSILRSDAMAGHEPAGLQSDRRIGAGAHSAEWSISMADDDGKMVADAERAVGEFGIKVLCMKSAIQGWREDVKFHCNP